MIEPVDAIVGGADGVHRDPYRRVHRHALRVDVDAEVPPVPVHLQDVQQRLDLFRRDDAHVEVLVVVAQRLAVPVRVCQAPLRQRPAEGVRQVLVAHQDVTDLRVHAAQRVPVVKKRPVRRIGQPRLHLAAEQDALDRGAEEDPAARFVRLGLERDTHAGHRVHRFDETIGEPRPHRREVDAQRVLVAVDTGPDDGEVRVKFPVQLERPRGPIDRFSTVLGNRIGERPPFELLVPEQHRDDGDQPDAGAGRKGLPEVEVLLVDLVGVVRFDADQAVAGEPGRDVEPLLDGLLRLVLRVKAAFRRREKPDPRRELQLQLEAPQVLDHL